MASFSSRILALPASCPPLAHLPLKNLSRYLLNWPKLISQSVPWAPGAAAPAVPPPGPHRPEEQACQARQDQGSREAQVLHLEGGRSGPSRGRSRDAQTGKSRLAGALRYRDLSAPGRTKSAVGDIQVPGPVVHSDAHKAPGKRGQWGWTGRHAQRWTHRTQRAVRQLPNLADLFLNALPHSSLSRPLPLLRNARGAVLCLEGFLQIPAWPTSWAPWHRLKIHLLNGSYFHTPI